MMRIIKPGKVFPACIAVFILWCCISPSGNARNAELALGTDGCRTFVYEGRSGENPIVVDDHTAYEDIAPGLEIFFDHSRERTPESLVSEPAFVPTNGRVAWGHHDAAVWLRFHYISKVSKPKQLNLKVLITGFPWTVQPGEQGTVLVYLDYAAGILTHTQLYAADAYKVYSDRRILLIGALLGINIGLVIFNIFIFIWTKDFSFLAYVLYLLSLTFHFYLREEYIDSLFPYLKDYYFGMPAIAFGVLFFQQFLETKKNSTAIHRFYNAMFVFTVLFSITNFGLRVHFSAYQTIQALFQAFLMLSVIIISLYMAFRLKVNGSFYFFASWLPIIIANAILQMEMLGTLQSDTPVLYFTVREGFYVAAAFQAVLLSIVLANKINIFRSKEALAQKEKKYLEEIDRMKTNFVMNVSHELRTPLTLILSSIDNIISGKLGETISSGHRHFQVVQRSASRLLFLINNLLEITRLEFKKFTIEKSPVSIDQYMRFIASEFESLARSRDIDFVYEKRCPDDPIVSVDLALLETALLNIMSNAFKFTPAGKSIRAFLETDSQNAILRIRDSGPGIPENQKKAIFDRFFQLESDNSRKYEGAGIGLSLAKEAVSINGGSINVENLENGGVDFIIHLPISGSPLELGETEFNETSITIVKNSFSEHALSKSAKIVISGELPKVMIVEDNDDLTDFLISELKETFSVLTAANGIEALSLMDRGEIPKLIISDVMMPKMDGLELFKKIRARGHSDIPFLFLTARASAEEKLEALKKGAMDYLYKPFSSPELHSKIRSIIQQDANLRQTVKHRLMEKVIQVFEEDVDNTREKTDQFRTDTLLKRFADAHALSAREQQVTTLLYKGKQDKEIAGELEIAVSTVSNTLSRVYKKAKVSGRVELLRKITDWNP